MLNAKMPRARPLDDFMPIASRWAPPTKPPPRIRVDDNGDLVVSLWELDRRPRHHHDWMLTTLVIAFVVALVIGGWAAWT